MPLLRCSQLFVPAALLILVGCQTANRQILPNLGQSAAPPSAEALAAESPAPRDASAAAPAGSPVAPAGFRSANRPVYQNQLPPTSWLAVPEYSAHSRSAAACSFG